MAILFQPRQKLLFIGNSITDAGRSQPFPYGIGFVRDCQCWLQAGYPELDLSVINRGVSGDTTQDLLARWERDAIRPQPDWLFIKVGINDVWSVFEGFYRQGIGVEDFERNYQALIEQTRQQTRAQIILIEPFLVEKNQRDNFRRVLSHYQAKVTQIAQEHNLLLVKLQQAFDHGLKSQPAEYWAEDRVHPTPVGHALIALQILKTCGFERLT
jgi:lysophospholipase L1-like esterase